MGQDVVKVKSEVSAPHGCAAGSIIMAESANTACCVVKEAYPGGGQKRYHHGSFHQRICRRGKRMEYKSWMCLICGWIYDEEAGLPEEGIAPGTKWEDVPINWTCPECGARKEDFEMVQI
jgi:rubredoxin